jgi:Flp pilus assembly pilin Flp
VTAVTASRHHRIDSVNPSVELLRILYRGIAENGAISKLTEDETGATLVEYALLLSLIAVVCVVVITLVGHNTSALLSTAASSL